MLKYHIITAFRNLARGRFSTFINIFGLALGMATTLFILLWVQNEWSFNTYHTDAERIYRIHSHIKVSDDETWHWGTSPLLLGDEAAAQLPEIEAFAKQSEPWNGKTFRLNGEIFREKKVAYVGKGWFDLFDYEMLHGSSADFFQHRQSVMLTASKAEQLFGTDAVLGRTIQVDTADFVVRGVIADNPTNSSFQYDVLIPMDYHLSNPRIYENEANWDNFNYNTFLKLSEKADAALVAQKMTQVLRANKPQDSTTYLTLLPLPAMHFDESVDSDTFEHGNAQTSRIFTIIGLLILLIACINYVSLTTARASIRAKEISVKKIMGAGKGSLFGQFMVESVVTSLTAMLLALGLVHLLLPFFNQIVERQFEFDYANPAIWLVLAGTAVLAILLTGIYPALVLSSFQPVKLLRGASWLGGNNAHFRKGLVITQFVISTALITSVIIISQQNKYIQNKALGYDRDHVFSVTIPYGVAPMDQLVSMRQVFANELRAESSIDQVAMANGNIVNSRSTHSGSLDWEGRSPNYEPSVAQLSVDAQFLEMFKLEMLEGRWFQSENKADEINVILNETAVKTFGLEPPYAGQRFSFHGNDGQIIGVVKDFHFRSLREKIMPMVLYNEPVSRGQLFIKTSGNRTADALAATRKIWRKALPSQPFEYFFLDESFEKLYRMEQRTGLLFNIFATIALVIACLGLLGLATFATERRTKEIGIRKVLGASISNIIALISTEFIGLVVIALFIASAISWWTMDNWLRDFAYRIDMQWWMFALAGMAAIAVALLTVGFQAFRAAGANPVNALRDE